MILVVNAPGALSFRSPSMDYRGYMPAARGPRPRTKVPTARTRQTSSARLVDGITQQLREMILEHQIAPGTVLLQIEWAERLKVSRTPLREAFRILEQDGLVRASNGNRTIQVVQFSGGELRDLYEVREAVDGLAARLLARRGLTDELDQEFTALLESMDGAVEQLDLSAWFSAHLGFHIRIAETCGNSRLRQQLNLIRMSCFSLHNVLIDHDLPVDQLREALETSGREHHSIYAALLSGDGELAERAASRHIQTALESGLMHDTKEAADKRAG